MLRIPGPGRGCGMQGDFNWTAPASSPPCPPRMGTSLFWLILYRLYQYLPYLSAPAFCPPPDNVVRFNKTTFYALRNTVFRICHNNGVVFADYLTIYSLSSIKLVGGWRFCNIKSIFISFSKTFSQHEDNLCRGWSAPWTSIAYSSRSSLRFIFSVFQPVCFGSKICIKVIVLNKADLETRQYSTKLKIIFIYYHIISHSRSGDEKYIPCRAWV